MHPFSNSKRSAMFVWVIGAVVAALLGASLASPSPAFASGTAYYVSASGGSDSNSGLSPTTAWRTLAKASTVTLVPGDSILLKAGDLWTGDTLTPIGSGSAALPITISSYGTGAKPHIAPGIGVKDYAIHLVEVDHYIVNGLEISNTYGGVVIYYNGTYGHSGIAIQNSYFHDITGKDTGFSITSANTNPSGAPRPDLYFGTAISFGFKGNGSTMLSDVYLTGNQFDRVDAGIDMVSDGPVTRTYVTNFNVTNSSFSHVYLTGSVMVYTTTGGTISHNTFDQGSGYLVGMFWGNASVQVTASANITVSYNDIGRDGRANNTPDGSAIDCESYNVNCTITNNYIHGGEGPGLLIFGANGYWGIGNSGTVVANNRIEYVNSDRYNANNAYFVGGSNTGSVTGNIVRQQNTAQNVSFAPLTDGGGNVVLPLDGNQFIDGVSSDDSGFTYSGGWTGCSACSQANGFYSSTAHYSRTASATTTVNFSGTQIQLFGVVGPDEGIGSVSIDGGSPTTFDAYSTLRTENIPIFTSSLLPEGSHTAVLTVTNTKNPSSSDSYITVDRAVVGNQLIGLSIDNSQTGSGVNKWTFAGGSWVSSTGISQSNGFFGETQTYASTAGHTATLQFNGTQVQLYGAVGPRLGRASVTIDGGAPTSIDTYNVNRQENALIFQSGALSGGSHTVQLTVSGTSTAGSGGTYIVVDRAVVAYSLSGTLVDDAILSGTNRFSYTGSWIACNACSQANGNYRGGITYSAAAGAVATVTFFGTRAVIYGITGPDQGILNISVDGGTAIAVDAYGIQRREGVPLFVSNTLSSGAHTITLTATGTKNASSTSTYVGVDSALIQ